jgi:hypothetical protein
VSSTLLAISRAPVERAIPPSRGFFRSFFIIFSFFYCFISQKFTVNLGKFADGASRSPAGLLTNQFGLLI